MIVCLGVLLMLFCSSVNAEVISRINYGVAFESQRDASAIYDYWSHTFRYKLPKLEPIQPYIIQCPNQTRFNLQRTVCRAYHDAFVQVNAIRGDYMLFLNKTYDHVVELMPNWEHQVIGKSRSKRKLFGFISSWGKHLFGFATQKDLKKMAEHIVTMESKQHFLEHSVAQITDDLSSYMAISNKHFKNLQEMATQNHDAVRRVTAHLYAYERTLTTSLHFTSILIREAYDMLSLQSALQDLLMGIEDLMRNKLSVHIVQYRDIQHVITKVNEKLLNHHSRLTVKDMTATDVYQICPFIWFHRGKYLYLTIKLPLVAPMAKLTLYKIHYFGVPINASTAHVTMLAADQQYLALSQDQMFYTYPKSEMIKDSIVNAQQFDLPLYPSVQQSCLTALFFDNPKEIKEFCDFRVILHKLAPSIQHLAVGRYIVSNVKTLFLTCPQGHQTHPGCSFCIYDVPCGCSFASETVYFPPRLGHCSTDNETATTLHPVILAILMHFYEHDKLDHIHADSLFHDVPSVLLPKNGRL